MEAFDWKKIIDTSNGAGKTPEPVVPEAVSEPPVQEPSTPVAGSFELNDEIPFAQHDYLIEEGKKSGHAPLVNPLAGNTVGMPPIHGAESFDSSGADFVKPAVSTNDGPPPMAPPAADSVLSIFNKPREEKPVAIEVPKTLSELNSADANSTRFATHNTGKEVTRFDGSKPVGDMHIDELLAMAVERRASDMHLTVGLPPMLRIDGEVAPLPFASLEPQDTRRLLYETLDDDKLQKFESTKEMDYSHAVKNLGRFRVNMFVQRGTVGGVLRVIPMRIPDFEELGLPAIIREMSKRTSGLILVTGPTGSGKSTTIAAMIDDINSTRRGHIMTIEDPIEYLHVHKQSIINQREMHQDTLSFHNALRAVLREDPDIILVGELRDLETIEAALTLAETGHLVFGTLHTRSAPATVDRIIDVFPPDSQEQIRVLLSNTLEGVISQQLLPKLGGGRVAALEIMLGTPAIRNLAREGKTHQMQSILETSGNVGMQTMDAMLAELYRSGKCEFEECMMRSIDRDTFSRLARAA